MKPITTLIVGSLTTIGCMSAQANEPLKIMDYLVDELWVCDTSDNCADIPRSQLPDPTKAPLLVKQRNPQDELVLTEIDGEDKWFEIIEVELNIKPEVTGKCSDGGVISKKSDSQIYASFGLGEGCG